MKYLKGIVEELVSKDCFVVPNYATGTLGFGLSCTAEEVPNLLVDISIYTKDDCRPKIKMMGYDMSETPSLFVQVPVSNSGKWGRDACSEYANKIADIAKEVIAIIEKMESVIRKKAKHRGNDADS